MSERQTNKKLAIDMVTVLTQPPVPPALHYVNPRTIMGEFEWNKLKKQYRLLADHHCMNCQRSVMNATCISTRDFWVYNCSKALSVWRNISK